MARRSNCFFFAWTAWWRWRHQGAYCAIRLSRIIWGWHWLVYHPRYKQWLHFHPPDLNATPKVWWRAAVWKLWYVGRIVRGDDDA